MRILALLVILAVVFFGLPLLNSVPLPQGFAPEQMGAFVNSALDYWKALFGSIGR